MPALTLGGILALHLLTCGARADAQPIPIELTLGRDGITTNLVVSRPFTKTSPIGFFHLSTLQFGYERDTETDMAIQNVLFAELGGGFRAIGGVFNTQRGFSPTAGLQFIKANRDLFLLVAPRVNIGSDPSYSIFSIVRYRPPITSRLRLYAAGQLLNTFDADQHIRSYQWLRIGLELKGTQVGFALNFDQRGPRRTASVDPGVFIRREIAF